MIDLAFLTSFPMLHESEELVMGYEALDYERGLEAGFRTCRLRGRGSLEVHSQGSKCWRHVGPNRDRENSKSERRPHSSMGFYPGRHLAKTCQPVDICLDSDFSF